MQVSTQPLAPFGRELLSVEVDTNLSHKAPLMFRLVHCLMEAGCVAPQRRELAELCFDEALTNAMLHGNALDPAKKVRVQLFCDEGRWGAIMEDEGQGFTPPPIAEEPDEETLLADFGRGILVMDAYLDELLYSERGNRLLMVRSRDPEARPGQTPAAEAPAYQPPEALDFEEEPAAAAGALAKEGAPAAASAQESPTFAALRREGEVGVIEVLVDRLDDANVDKLRAEAGALAEDCRWLLFDLGPVRYISSVVLGAFAGLAKRLRPNGGGVRVCAAQPMVLEVLKAARFDRIVHPQPDQAAALEHLRETT